MFDPKGKPVTASSDGIGTKTEFYVRSGEHYKAIRDTMAMKLDDLIKIGATAKVLAEVIETNRIPTGHIIAEYEQIAGDMDILGITQVEDVGDRIATYKKA